MNLVISSRRSILFAVALGMCAPVVACGSSDSNDSSAYVTITGSDAGLHHVGVPVTVHPAALVTGPCAGYVEKGPFGCSNQRVCQGGPESSAIAATVDSATCDGCTVTATSSDSITLVADHDVTATLTITMKKNDGSGSVTSSVPVDFAAPSAIDVSRTSGDDDFDGATLQGAANTLLVGQKAIWVASVVDANGDAFDDPITVTPSGDAAQIDDEAGFIEISGVSKGIANMHLEAGTLARDVTVRVADETDVASVELVGLDVNTFDEPQSIDDDVIMSYPPLGASYVFSSTDCYTLRVGARTHFADGTVGLAPASEISLQGIVGVVTPADASATYAEIVVPDGLPNPVTFVAKVGDVSTTTAVDLSACAP